MEEQWPPASCWELRSEASTRGPGAWALSTRLVRLQPGDSESRCAFWAACVRGVGSGAACSALPRPRARGESRYHFPVAAVSRLRLFAPSSLPSEPEAARSAGCGVSSDTSTSELCSVRAGLPVMSLPEADGVAGAGDGLTGPDLGRAALPPRRRWCRGLWADPGSLAAQGLRALPHPGRTSEGCPAVVAWRATDTQCCVPSCLGSLLAALGRAGSQPAPSSSVTGLTLPLCGDGVLLKAVLTSRYFTLTPQCRFHTRVVGTRAAVPWACPAEPAGSVWIWASGAACALGWARLCGHLPRSGSASVVSRLWPH